MRLIVGIEYDRLDNQPWPYMPHDLQLCQWTIAAAPGHPVFAAMIQQSLHELAGSHNTTCDPTDLEVMKLDGARGVDRRRVPAAAASGD